MANVRINGVGFSYSTMTITWGGVRLTSVQSVDWSINYNRENITGIGGEPIQVGAGDVEYTASITMLMDEWRNLVRAAPLKNPRLIPQTDLTMVNVGVDPFVNVIKGALIGNISQGMSSGDTSISVEIELIISGIDFGA
jgi:hypothetical protein